MMSKKFGMKFLEPILVQCDKEERNIFCILSDPKKITILQQYNFIEIQSIIYIIRFLYYFHFANFALISEAFWFLKKFSVIPFSIFFDNLLPIILW